MARTAAIAAILITVVWLAAGVPAAAGLELYTYETEFLKLIYYNKDHEYLVPHLARSFENSLAFHRELFDYTPSEPIVILLHDFGDYGHGGTSTVPWNYITIGIEPFDHVYETMPSNERMNWLMNHELVHVVATDKGAGPDNRARRFFAGKVAPTDKQPMSIFYSWLTSPRWYSPRWYHEGIAVFLETWMAGGIGRTLGGYDEMAFRAMVHEGRYFYDVVGLESEGTTIDFQVGQNSYLYGTRFVTYLGREYGPEKVIRWFDRSDDSKRYFSKQFKQVFGLPLDQAWAEWKAFEQEWQQQNLALLREYPITEDQPVLDLALGSASRPHYDPVENKIYMAINYPARSAHIAAIDLDDGSIKRLTGVSQPALYYVTSLTFDAEARKLFFTSDNTRGWRDLHEYDLATGKRRRVLKDFRAGNLVVDKTDHAIWGIQHHNGLSSIVRIPRPYESWETLITLDYGRDVFDIDLSPDGRTLSAGLIEISGRQRLVSLDTAALRSGSGTFEVLHEFENNGPENFSFSADGRYLYGTSYYTGVSNVFRFDRQEKKIEAITNTDIGYFRPLPLDDERLFALRYTSDGMRPVTLPIEVLEDINALRYLGQQVVEKHPVVKEWNVGSPMQVDLDQVTTGSGDYDAGGRMRFASWYPVVEGYRDTYAFGVRLNIADPMALHSLDITATYSQPDNVPSSGERYHFLAEYDHFPWKLQAGVNPSNFYDLAGPTEVSRKGKFVRVNYENYIFNHRPKSMTYNINLAGFTGLDTLPLYQNVDATVDEYASLYGGFAYTNLKRTIGAVEPEKGIAWDFTSINNYGDGEVFSKAYSSTDFGFLTGIDHSSIWFRSSAGWSFGDEIETFSNFYFGGFGNNYVDHGSVRRYRDYYALPGFELNELEANNFGKLTLEWVLPPIRFREAGRPGFYANWMQFALFSSGVVANFSGDLPRREVGTVGLQVDMKLVLFSTLESTMSIGYASAFEESADSKDEVMFSLKILR